MLYLAFLSDSYYPKKIICNLWYKISEKNHIFAYSPWLLLSSFAHSYWSIIISWQRHSVKQVVCFRKSLTNQSNTCASSSASLPPLMKQTASGASRSAPVAGEAANRGVDGHGTASPPQAPTRHQGGRLDGGTRQR
jgi:hypothetical protein